jgi:hypothetical protein
VRRRFFSIQSAARGARNFSLPAPGTADRQRRHAWVDVDDVVLDSPGLGNVNTGRRLAAPGNPCRRKVIGPGND